MKTSITALRIEWPVVFALCFNGRTRTGHIPCDFADKGKRKCSHLRHGYRCENTDAIRAAFGYRCDAEKIILDALAPSLDKLFPMEASQ